MSLKDFDIDRIDAPETPEHRTMRAMLRLSNDWKVIGRTVEYLPSEYPDEHPEVREVVDSDDLSGIGKSLDVSRIYISAVRKKRNLCPCCGHSCHTISYETRYLRHIDDMGCKCYLVVNIPKYRCDHSGSTPRKNFPAAFPRVSYTREFAKRGSSRLRVDCLDPVSLMVTDIRRGAGAGDRSIKGVFGPSRT